MKIVFTSLYGRIRTILFDYHIESSEWLLGATASIYGLWLLLPAKTFYNPVYRAMEYIAPEGVWGVYMTIIGLIQIVSVMHGNRSLRRRTAFAMCITWTFLAISYYLADPSSVAVGIFSLFAISTAGIFLRLGGNRN